MVDEQKDVVQTPKGEPDTASKEKEPNASQPGQIDLAGRYKIDKAGTEVLGNELLGLANRGKMFDKTQSELHKTQEALKNLTDEYKKSVAEINQIRQEQMVREQVSRMIPKNRKTTEEEEWGEEETPNEQIDQNEIVRQVSKISNEPVAKILSRLGLKDTDDIPDIDVLIERKLQLREAELTRKREQENWIRQVREQDEKQLSTDYGSVLSPSEIKNILDSMDVAVALQRRAETSITDPNTEQDAIEDYSKSRDLLLKTAEKIADAKIKSEAKARDEEIRTQLTSGKFPGLEPRGEERKPVFKEADYREKKKKARENAAKLLEQAERAKLQLGGS